jgi:hypothetical protein
MFETVLEAVEMDNLGVRLSTEDREGYFRIFAPHRLRLPVRAWRRFWESHFGLRDLNPTSLALADACNPMAKRSWFSLLK